MSSIAKANISLSKKDLSKSRIPPVASRNVVFYHKATAGSLTINLLALTMPSAEMPTATQATNPEISGAQLMINKKNLELTSSSNGKLIQDLDYVVIDSYTISLIGPYIGVGADADEIFVGTINSAPISDLVVASAKSVDKTYELAVGSTVLNLGREYKVGANPFENVGSIKVFVNGVLALRDVDYTEIDSGNGYGTTIQFMVAPVSLPHQVAVDFGVMAITDNNAIGAIENLGGAIKKIADDLAVVAGTTASDYYSASPSEVERRAFGDWILKMLDVEVELPKKYVQLHHNQLGNTLLSTNQIKFNTSLFIVSGNETPLISMDNSGTATRFYVSKKCKVSVSCRIIIDDGTANASIVVYFNNDAKSMQGDEIPATGTAATIALTFIEEVGQYFRISLPLGFANTSSSAIIQIYAESLEENSQIRDIIGI